MCVGGAGTAQDGVLSQLYGNGVHAYFAGDYAKAHELLSSAISSGSRDPRCYYFRGLSYWKLGRPQEAAADFQQGAKYESGDLNRTYSVARSLERVQGAARMAVEQYRIQARAAALEQAERFRKARYEEINRQERRTVESQAGKGGTEGVAPPEARPADNPFATGSGAAAEKPAVEKPAMPATEKPEAPAETKAPAKAAAPAVSDDPFSGGAAEGKKSAEEPAEESGPKQAPAKKAGAAAGKQGKAAAKAAASDDPFAGDDKAANDKPAEKKAPSQKAAGKSGDQKSEADDPFGQ